MVIYYRIRFGTRIQSRNSETLLVTLLSKIRHLKSDANSTVDDQPLIKMICSFIQSQTILFLEPTELKMKQ